MATIPAATSCTSMAAEYWFRRVTDGERVRSGGVCLACVETVDMGRVLKLAVTLS